MTQTTSIETSSPAPTSSAPASTAPATPLDVAFERARALLMDLGPADALRVLGGISGAIATKAREEAGDDALATTWASWSSRMQQLAAAGASPAVTSQVDQDDDAEAEDDEEESEDTDETEETAEARPPRKERTKMRRLVAGMFDVSARAESCRLREVNALGAMGEPVGFANAEGIEETEWPIALMTGELLSRLTPRGGKFRFEWFGRDGSGGRVALGRSRTFKVQARDAKDSRKGEAEILAPAPAPIVVTGGNVSPDQLFAMFRYGDERVDRERTRQIELEQRREEVASKERIEKMRFETEMLKARASMPGGFVDPNGPLTPATVAAIIDHRLAEHFPAPDEDDDESDQEESGAIPLPPWVKAIGLNEQTIKELAPQLVQLVIGLVTNMGPSRPDGAGLPGFTPPPAAAGEGGAQ